MRELHWGVDDDRSVSTVVGVVLMVGITVLLVSVVAVTVLGFGGELEDPGPTVSFSYEYDEAADELTISHEGGGSLDAGEIYLKWGGKTVAWTAASSVSTIESGHSVTIGDFDTNGDGFDSWDKVGPEEKVFVVRQPSPEAATILGRWQHES